MQARGIHLQYRFESESQRGAQVENPLFDLLAAVREQGSIRAAAAALGQSYRHVWGALKHWEGVLGEPLVHWVKGQPAQLTTFAQRLLWAETQARVRMTPHIEALRAELDHALAQALDGSQKVLEVFASHDLALPQLRALAAQRSLHLGLRFAGSLDALHALARGRCTVAGFHVPAQGLDSNVFRRALKPLLAPGRHKLIACLRRTQGLMQRPGAAPLSGLMDVAERGLRFVNRPPGSGTRLLMDHLLAAQGLTHEQIDGYDTRHEDSHVAVAAAVASGAADVAPGIEAAARRFGLMFSPLVQEDYHLVCLKGALETPAVQALRETLASAAWAAALEHLPGYAAVPNSGEVLSLTAALPWWRYGAHGRPSGEATRGEITKPCA